jgi:hypothetical protein
MALGRLVLEGQGVGLAAIGKARFALQTPDEIAALSELS